MLDGLTCLYKSSVDLFFYVIGSGQENELLLMSVLDCLFNSCSGILRKNVDKKSLCDNMEVRINQCSQPSLTAPTISRENSYKNIMKSLKLMIKLDTILGHHACTG